MSLKNILSLSLAVIIGAIALAQGVILPSLATSIQSCGAPVIPPPKPGVCPIPGGTPCPVCVDFCLSDFDCPGNMKCCIEPFCGNRCRVPF